MEGILNPFTCPEVRMSQFNLQAIHGLPETASSINKIEGKLQITLPQSHSRGEVYF